MRKYLATVIQVMALPKYQLNWVAEHLGHSREVHDKYYKQSLDSVEIAKISKLMFLVDHCKMNAVQGMNLDNVDTFLENDDIFKSVNPSDYEGCYTNSTPDEEADLLADSNEVADEIPRQTPEQSPYVDCNDNSGTESDSDYVLPVLKTK